MINKLGIIAGSGTLPSIAAREAYQQNIDLQIYSLSKTRLLEEEYIPELSHLIQSASVMRLGSLIKQLKKDEISDILLLGKVEKKDIFKSFLFDQTTLSLLKSMVNQNDNTIFYGVLKEFESHGFKLISQKIFLESLLLSEGVYSKKKPNESEWEDIRYGMFHAKEISGLDIGQTVIVRNKSVVAVEAMEGTDECIRRVREITDKGKLVVCKVEKKNQDERFDIPTVGLQTLDVMKKSGCRVLAIEADKTFVVTPEEMRKRANQLGIIVVAVTL